MQNAIWVFIDNRKAIVYIESWEYDMDKVSYCKKLHFSLGKGHWGLSMKYKNSKDK